MKTLPKFNTTIRLIATASIALATVFPDTLTAQENEDSPRIDRLAVPISLESPLVIEASLLHGGITVEGYEGSEVIVEAKNASIRQRKEEIDPNGLKIIRSSSSGLYIEAENNVIKIGSRSMNKAVDISIRSPHRVSLKLNCMNRGDILVKGIEGELDLGNLNGKITVLNSKGTVLANGLNQNIEIVLDEVTGENPMSFISLNGTIDVTLPPDTKANLRMESFAGNIKSDFDIEILTDSNEPKLRSGPGSGNTYHAEFEQAIIGKINGGGPQYLFKSHNGDILIRRGSSRAERTQ